MQMEESTTLPKDGWSSLTLDNAVLKMWQNTYETNKELLRLKGVTSFSAFVNSIMYGVMFDQDLLLKAIASGNRLTIQRFKQRSQH